MYEILKENNGESKKSKIYSSRTRFIEQRQRNMETVIIDLNQVKANDDIVIHFMSTNWDNNLSTGIDNIDNQHKKLFNHISKLVSHMNEGKSKSEIIKTLDKLKDHLLRHFNEEEAIQKQNNYPGFTFHHNQHEELKNGLKELRNVIETKEISAVFIVNIQQCMFKWFREHIINLDKDLGVFLIEKFR